MIDLDNLSMNQLSELKLQVDDELKRRQEERLDEALDEIAAIAQGVGKSLHELFPSARVPKQQPQKPVPPKRKRGLKNLAGGPPSSGANPVRLQTDLFSAADRHEKSKGDRSSQK